MVERASINLLLKYNEVIGIRRTKYNMRIIFMLTSAVRVSRLRIPMQIIS